MEINELEKRLDAQDAILARIAKDVHRIKQFFLWSMIATVVTFIIPLVIAAIAIPFVMSKYLSSFDSLL